MAKVIIDAGHSGQIEPGAVGPAGTKEADITLRVAVMLAEEVAALGIKALMTRTSDIDNDALTWRANLANENNADAFISIHCNSATNPMAEGYEIWTSPGQTEGDHLADLVFEEISVAFPDLYPRTDMSDGDVDKEACFTVITATNCPAILVELEFINNPDREQLLLNPGFQRMYAKAMAKGINRFLNDRED
jgi:N-acetylmuramoyl-L-alanine amidase